MNNDLINRRIKFLLEAAKYEPKKDQAITFIMRVLSNHATVGKDASSEEVKKLNRLVSKKAKELLFSTNIKTYVKNTINEHQKPLNETWNWIKSNVDKLEVKDVWQEFKDFQMVTITKEEDLKIKASGQNSSGSFKTRYDDLGIGVVKLEKAPKDYAKD